MASTRQIEANRQNAQKSTGPKTDEGKNKVSQNAVKSGFHTLQNLISGESPQDFAVFSLNLKKELAPKGPMEEALADRAVTLLWRLNRAVRLQTGACDLLLNQAQRPDPDTPAALGQMIVDDFRTERILDNLLRHERAIEQSLYKTLIELQRLQFIRTKYQSLLMDGSDYCDGDFIDGREQSQLEARSQLRLSSGVDDDISV